MAKQKKVNWMERAEKLGKKFRFIFSTNLKEHWPMLAQIHHAVTSARGKESDDFKTFRHMSAVRTAMEKNPAQIKQILRLALAAAKKRENVSEIMRNNWR